MPNEHPTGLGTAGKKPPIPVTGTVVNLSELNRHANGPASKQVAQRETRSPTRRINQIVEDVLKVKNPKAPTATRAADGTF